jgi:pimeloyl-ACP methyl ester carboxylesterase
MPKTLLQKFLETPFEEQADLLKDPKTSADVKQWLGEKAFGEFSALLPKGHLGAGPRNIVFVPGVMGSVLQSEGFGGVWWLDVLRAREQIDQLALKTDGSGDALADADIRPATVDVSYVGFRRAVSDSTDFGGTTQFPYDWRRSIETVAAGLRDTIMRCHEEYGDPVHLVGHSMGGLVIRTTLMRYSKDLWPKVGKVVFIGTPHYGAPAIAGYVKNHLWGWDELAVLGLFLSRKTFRSMRGVFNLLPAPNGVYPGTRSGEEHPCANFNLYDAVAYKLDKLDASEILHLQSVLDQTAQLHRDLYAWHSGLLQEFKDRMLMIAGVGYKTMFRLEFDSALWGAWERTRKVTDRTPGDPNRDGDGRVPLASAQLEDVETRYVKGVHGGLQNLPAVSRDVLAWLTDKDLRLSQTPEDALGSHLSADEPNPAPNLDGTSASDPSSDEFDRFRDIPEQRVKELVKELDAGRLPNINLARIL